MRVLSGDQGVLSDWLRFGGLECLLSYGITLEKITNKSEVAVLRLIRETVPEEHQVFLASFADTFRFGDFLFVHAGIRPGVHLTHQSEQDLRWIREPFLDDDTDHGFVVVHGHTITDQIDERSNRIGIDTGAYRSGVLTAMAVEGSQRWYLDTRADE